MKNILFICLSLVFGFLSQELTAQAPPQKMTYQFVARNAQNQLIQNNAVGLRISILQGSATGNAVYVETHTPQTNGNGTATIEVGGGTVVSGVFANIDWSTGVYFIQTEMDPQGQQGYSVTAVSQLLSVPYAFYAGRATYADSVSGGMSETDPTFNASVAAGITPADTARWNQDLVNDADSDPTNELQTLTAVGNTISLSNGGSSVTLTERDSIFAASLAAGITAADTARWNNSANDWKLNGNAGTNPSTNFIGTVDTQDFVVRTNNVERMRVSSNGNIGIGTTNNSSQKLHILGSAILQDENGSPHYPLFFLDNAGLTRSHFRVNSDPNYTILEMDALEPTATSDVSIRFFRMTNTTGVKAVNFLRGNGLVQMSASIGVDGTNSYFQMHGGNLGIGTTTPRSKLEVQAGDVYINNISSGVIMKSPNGSCWRVTVDNTGNLVRTAIVCP